MQPYQFFLEKMRIMERRYRKILLIIGALGFVVSRDVAVIVNRFEAVSADGWTSKFMINAGTQDYLLCGYPFTEMVFSYTHRFRDTRPLLPKSVVTL